MKKRSCYFASTSNNHPQNNDDVSWPHADATLSLVVTFPCVCLITIAIKILPAERRPSSSLNSNLHYNG